jgi:hypothetical protein
MFQAPYYARWIELRNVSTCRIDIDGVGVRSRRLVPGGADENEMTVASTTWLESGERVVFSSHSSFPVVPRLINEPTDTNAWLFTPDVVFIRRGSVTLQQLVMPENFAINSGYARALPEGACATVNPNNASTWPGSLTAVTPNPTDFGETGTPGAPNDTACP